MPNNWSSLQNLTQLHLIQFNFTPSWVPILSQLRYLTSLSLATEAAPLKIGMNTYYKLFLLNLGALSGIENLTVSFDRLGQTPTNLEFPPNLGIPLA